MKTFTMVGLFIFLFLAPISKAQTEKPVGDNLTTAPSDSFWGDYVSQVVVLMCSTLITLLALIKKTWNDDKYIPFYRRPIWPWGHIGIIAIVIILIAGYQVLHQEYNERESAKLKLEEAESDRQAMIIRLKEAESDRQAMIIRLKEANNKLVGLSNETFGLSIDVEAAKSQIDSTLNKLQDVKADLQDDISGRTELLETYLNNHVVKTLGALADTTKGVPFLIKENKGLISQLADTTKGVPYMIKKNNEELIEDLTKSEGELFKKIDEKNRKVDSVLADYKKLEAFTKKMMDTSKAKELIQKFFQFLQNPDQISELQNLLSQKFVDYTLIGTSDTSQVSNIGGMIKVPYENMNIKLTEILGGPAILSVHFSWSVLQDIEDRMQDSQEDITEPTTITDKGDVSLQTVIEIRELPKITGKGFILFVIENDVIASISGTWNIVQL